jgi:hypothetical protein
MYTYWQHQQRQQQLQQQQQQQQDRRFYFLTCYKEGLKTILRILKKTVKEGKTF